MTNEIIKRIIVKLLHGEDYRSEVIPLIDAEFLRFAIDFFKEVVQAKMERKVVTEDWYKKKFLNPNQDKTKIAVHAGLNTKTIHNMFNTSTKEVVLHASEAHYKKLHQTIKDLISTEPDMELRLTIKFKDVSVELSLNESLLVINSLAVKRAALRGGLWSQVGKRVEKPLMQTLCILYGVQPNSYSAQPKTKDNKHGFSREVDFYLLKNSEKYKCEVKLMGKGNPESADAVIARGSKVFVADKLSTTNKNQLDHLGVQWIELRGSFERFSQVLKNLNIPHHPLPSNWSNKLEDIFKQLALSDT